MSDSLTDLALAIGRQILTSEAGTIDVELEDGERRAIVYMPRWFYGLALAALLGFGILIGLFVL